MMFMGRFRHCGRERPARPTRAARRAWMAAFAGVMVWLVIASSSTAGGTCGSVYWRSLRSGDQRCPRSHSILADVRWIGLRWSAWNARGAVGDGFAVHYSTGTIVDERDPITIHLYGTERCSDGRRIYSRISVTWSYVNAVRRYSWSYRCRPRPTSRGAGGGGG